MLARDLGESQGGFYLWATKKVEQWNRNHRTREAEWQKVHIPPIMTGVVREAQQGNRAVRILYRRDVATDQVDSVQLI